MKEIIRPDNIKVIKKIQISQLGFAEIWEDIDNPKKRTMVTFNMNNEIIKQKDFISKINNDNNNSAKEIVRPDNIKVVNTFPIPKLGFTEIWEDIDNPKKRTMVTFNINNEMIIKQDFIDKVAVGKSKYDFSKIKTNNNEKKE